MSFISNFFSPPKPPPAPDYAGAATAQGAANVETAIVEGTMNRPDIFSPYDVTRWTDIGTKEKPRFQADYTLRPEYETQRAKQAQIGGQYLDVAGQRLGELPSGQFDFGALPAYQSTIDTAGFTPLATAEDLGDYATRSEASYYNRAYGRLKPAQDMEKTQLHTQLINSGLPPGSVAYNDAMNRLEMAHSDALTGLAQQSIAEGQRMRTGLATEAQSMRQGQLAEATMMQQMQNQARQQALSEALLGRRLPMEELATLTGSPSIGAAGLGTATTGLDVPGTAIAPPPIFAATQAQGAEGMNRYGQQMAGYGARMQMLGNLAGGAMASDKTLKENIIKVGKSALGFNIYEFNYLWSPKRFRGVIAQEVQKIKPQAVLSNIFGHLLVDYSKLDVNMEQV